ncbi:MAG: hypothetical protein Q8O34_11270 [Rhodocyclaceae bacterium]|nr:hypothetical protein [Rhodocyclaceae bacterium]
MLGSASGVLLQQASESLAGRVAQLELAPLQALEVLPADATAANLDPLWIRGGFPLSWLAPDDAASLRWRDAFIATYLERDIPAHANLRPRIPATTLRRLWTMLAHGQGGLLNQSQLAASLAVSGQTVARYIDLLCDLMLVRRLPACPPGTAMSASGWCARPRCMCATAASCMPCSALPPWRRCWATRWPDQVGKAS